ncbi:MAG: polyphenol oxidase family protein [Bifidobacterium aquikefiri]|uniref:Copper oxidase n=1 Tax=Bifidobacterium aquikefiri TaxID=1653207 RepID=A0A261G9B2_9BIFI|nr:polyphenol oxidase family protein [Bifidobacterium aquikefiri]OZG67823.1 copper oxidase [Bifidobacterium aquikefiri]
MQESSFNLHAESVVSAQILDDTRIDDHDSSGNPIPVTIPIDLAPGVRVTYTTRLGGISTGSFAQLNLGGKGGDNPRHVLANRRALSQSLHAPLALVSQVHSGHAIDIDDVWKHNADFGFDASGTAVHEPAVSSSAVSSSAVSSSSVSSQLVSSQAVSHGGQRSQSPDSEDISVQGIAGTVIDADGQISEQSDVALGMFAADCLPVLLADPNRHIIAAAHCGRKGLQRGIIAATVARMQEHGAQLDNIVATLGPCICGDCYEVGDEIAADFDVQFPGAATQTRFGGKGIDIAKAATMALHDAGVVRLISSIPRVNAATQYLEHDQELADLCSVDGEGPVSLAERIADIRHSLCTLENPLWFSHRRATLAHKSREGRMLALIAQHR